MKMIKFQNFKNINPDQLKILCIGCGSLFGHFIYSAVQRGFRNFTLIDPDKYEKRNLEKNPWICERDIGLLKVDYWKTKLSSLNKGIISETIPKKIIPEQEEELINKNDLLMLFVDNNLTRIGTQIFCLFGKTPLIDSASGIYGEGQKLVSKGGRVKVWAPGAPCLFCQGVRNSVEESRFKPESGSYVVGTHQVHDTSLSLNQTMGAIASEILEKFVNVCEVPVELRYDELNLQMHTISHSHDPDCPICNINKVKEGCHESG